MVHYRIMEVWFNLGALGTILVFLFNILSLIPLIFELISLVMAILFYHGTLAKYKKNWSNIILLVIDGYIFYLYHFNWDSTEWLMKSKIGIWVFNNRNPRRTRVVPISTPKNYSKLSTWISIEVLCQKMHQHLIIGRSNTNHCPISWSWRSN